MAKGDVKIANLSPVLTNNGSRRITLSLPGVEKSAPGPAQANADDSTSPMANDTPAPAVAKGSKAKKEFAQKEALKKSGEKAPEQSAEMGAAAKASPNDPTVDPLAPLILAGTKTSDLLPTTPPSRSAGISGSTAAGMLPPELSELYSSLAKRDSANVTVRHLSLLVQQVLARNPDIMQAEALSRQADERVKEAQWGRFPTANLSGTFGKDNQTFGATNKSTKMRSSLGQLKVTAPILDAGLNSLIEQRQSASVESDWQLTQVREDLMMRTVVMFAELVRANRLVELARGNLKSHRDYVAQMKSIARTDMGRAADLPAAQARVALAESVLISRLSRLDSARVQWTQLTSLPAPDAGSKVKAGQDTGIVLSELPLVNLPPTVDVAVANAVENSAQLQKALAEIETAKAALGGTKASLLPKLNAEMTGKRANNYAGTAGKQNSWYVGLGFDWTVPINPGRGASVNAAEEGLLAVMHARERLMQQVKAKVEEQWYALLASDNSLKSFQSYVHSSQKVVEAYQQQFRIGRRSLLDVLNAENELFNARSNYETARADLTQSAWKLLAMQGKLREELGL